MTDHIWYMQAATDVQTHRGYRAEALAPNGLGPVWDNLRRTVWRAQHNGDPADPTAIPRVYRHKVTDPDKKLDLPVWRSFLVQMRSDVVEVLRHFDLGQTALQPITVHLADDAGVRDDFFTFVCANVRPTIDKERSEPLRRAQKSRSSLFTSKVIHNGVVALRSSLEGPDIWHDPEIHQTVFVSDQLARALLAEDFGKQLKLKRVKLVAVDDR